MELLYNIVIMSLDTSYPVCKNSGACFLAQTVAHDLTDDLTSSKSLNA